MKNLIITSLITIIICLIMADLLSNKAQPLDYQIELQDTTALLYDGNNLIRHFEYTGELKELIIKDNQ